MRATALHTDLYQLTMIAGYLAGGVENQRATFELFIRRLPPHRSFVIAAGLDTALDFIESLRFTEEDVRWIQAIPALRRASPAFFGYLRQFRFTGDVWAVAEGTPFFPYEPVIRVTAPLAEAQLLETALLAIVNFQIIDRVQGGEDRRRLGRSSCHGVRCATGTRRRSRAVCRKGRAYRRM